MPRKFLLSMGFPFSRDFIVFGNLGPFIGNFAPLYVLNVFMRVVVGAFYRHPDFVGFRVLYRTIAEVTL